MKLIKFIFASVLMFSGVAKADPPDVHGMLLFGDQVSYASHLPMFHAPHDYQVILELNLSDIPRSQTLYSYQQAKDEGSTLFTLVPSPLDLSKIIDGSISVFNASIYEGHFERGGRRLGLVKVKVAKVVFASKLDAEQEPTYQEEYLVFGKSGEYFSAHLIKDKPSFDAVMKVSQPKKHIELNCPRRACPFHYLAVPDSDLPQKVPSDIIAPEVGNVLGSMYSSVHTVVQLPLYF